MLSTHLFTKVQGSLTASGKSVLHSTARRVVYGFGIARSGVCTRFVPKDEQLARIARKWPSLAGLTSERPSKQGASRSLRAVYGATALDPARTRARRCGVLRPSGERRRLHIIRRLGESAFTADDTEGPANEAAVFAAAACPSSRKVQL